MPRDIGLAHVDVGRFWFQLGGIGAGLARIGSHAFQHMTTDPCSPRTCLGLREFLSGTHTYVYVEREREEKKSNLTISLGTYFWFWCLDPLEGLEAFRDTFTGLWMLS